MGWRGGSRGRSGSRNGDRFVYGEVLVSHTGSVHVHQGVAVGGRMLVGPGDDRTRTSTTMTLVVLEIG